MEPEVEHIETVELSLGVDVKDAKKTYRHATEDTPDEELPFIDKKEVKSKKGSNKERWIVIDNIIYDCSDFVFEHPGGQSVIENFQGEDCTWQFWRFHDKDDMMTFGRPLRVGRTTGVENRFKERPRFLGLRRLGATDDDGQL